MEGARLVLEGFSPTVVRERYGSVDEDAMGWVTEKTVEEVALLAVSLLRGREKGLFSDALECKQKDSSCWYGLCLLLERWNSRVLLDESGGQCR